MEERTSGFVQILREICREEEIRLQSFSDNWAHRLEKDGQTGFIVGYSFGLNSASVQEICRDKALTSMFLAEKSVPAAEHCFLPLPLSLTDEEMKAYLELCRTLLERDGRLVLKDNYGTGGNRVYRIESLREAEETLRKIQGFSYAAALSPYYPIDAEYRVVMLDKKAELVIRKERAYRIENGKKVFTEWRHNLGQGATGVMETDERRISELSALAHSALQAIPARFASVDIIRVGEELRVLEINGGVMLEHFASQNASCRAEAKRVYRGAVLKMLAKAE